MVVGIASLQNMMCLRDSESESEKARENLQRRDISSYMMAGQVAHIFWGGDCLTTFREAGGHLASIYSVAGELYYGNDRFDWLQTTIQKSRTHLMLAIALVDLFSALRRDSYLDP
jgi:hypothetical protein